MRPNPQAQMIRDARVLRAGSVRPEVSHCDAELSYSLMSSSLLMRFTRFLTIETSS